VSTYFKIPFDKVPNSPVYKVWYASWSTQRPILEAGMPPPVVVGFIEGDALPAGATPIVSVQGVKSPPPPPPPLAPVSDEVYRDAVAAMLSRMLGV
jgi:hypothetical protein